MKKTIRYALSLVLLTALLLSVSCAAPKTPPEYHGADKNGEYISGCGTPFQLLTVHGGVPAGAATVPAPDSAFRAALTEAGVKLLQGCEKQDGDNVLVSPLSVFTALAMVTNGADGNTLAELQGFLGGADVDVLNRQLLAYTASLPSEKDAAFRTANSLWLTSRPIFSVNKNFLSVIENNYYAEVFSIDFSQRKDASDAVNLWCRDHTDGMIPQILTPDDVSADTIMALVNALCFDALWESPFYEGQCGTETFHGKAGDTAVRMMRGETGGYIRGSHETGFIKRYAGGKYAFAAILPDKGTDISEYVARLDAGTLCKLLDKASGRNAEIALPAFALDYDVSLNDLLKALGIRDAFDPENADFTGLGVLTDPTNYDNVFISAVLHKTHIEVDPSGTRAAAVTAVIMDAECTSAPAEPDPRVILDRPFVYAIIDTASRSPVFLGVCENVPAA